MVKVKARGGRRRGGKNRGYFLVTGRGWVASDGKRQVALRTEDGERLKEGADAKAVKAAYERFRKAKAVEDARGLNRDRTPLLTVCEAYLRVCQQTDSNGTFERRQAFLWDFCTGLPERFKPKENGKPAKTPTAADRIHLGYGAKPVGELIKYDVVQWLQAHPKWTARGGQRFGVQALKRALNWATEMGLISANPIRGMKVASGKVRITYFTEEQEQAMYQHAQKRLGEAIYVCIRTGARYGCEFCRLTDRHVTFEGDDRMVWKFEPHESKTGRATGKPRIIRIRDPKVIAIVRRQLGWVPTGEPLFRNAVQRPWTGSAIRRAFSRLRKRLASKGVRLDDGACMYSCRHTFAKRTINGFWTGEKQNIETVAKLMGNSPAICRGYADFIDSYTEPLWDAV
ncbi:MAG TPA: hypothetical protein VHC22_17840 [Pirellulales bacterium]|nr:hypothetical protein [Pirellulales bacterium]